MDLEPISRRISCGTTMGPKLRVITCHDEKTQKNLVILQGLTNVCPSQKSIWKRCLGTLGIRWVHGGNSQRREKHSRSRAPCEGQRARDCDAGLRLLLFWSRYRWLWESSGDWSSGTLSPNSNYSFHSNIIVIAMMIPIIPVAIPIKPWLCHLGVVDGRQDKGEIAASARSRWVSPPEMLEVISPKMYREVGWNRVCRTDMDKKRQLWKLWQSRLIAWPIKFNKHLRSILGLILEGSCDRVEWNLQNQDRFKMLLCQLADTLQKRCFARNHTYRARGLHIRIR